MADRTRLTDEQVAALRDVLFPELVRLTYRGAAFLERLHGQGEFTAGRRGILVDLARQGPQTVPQMARSRAVSRQYIQRLVNGLIADGLALLIRNPAHRRSPLVQITPRGSALVEVMQHREAAMFARLPLDASEAELRAAAILLRRIVAAFDGFDPTEPTAERPRSDR